MIFADISKNHKLANTPERLDLSHRKNRGFGLSIPNIRHRPQSQNYPC